MSGLWFQWLTRHNLLYNPNRPCPCKAEAWFQWLTRHNLLYNAIVRVAVNRGAGFNGSLAITFSTTVWPPFLWWIVYWFQWLTRHNLLYNASCLSAGR